MPSPARPAPSGPRQPLKPLVHSRAVLQDTMREVTPITARICSTCSPQVTLLDVESHGQLELLLSIKAVLQETI